jgi:hypothetical protein
MVFLILLQQVKRCNKEEKGAKECFIFQDPSLLEVKLITLQSGLLIAGKCLINYDYKMLDVIGNISMSQCIRCSLLLLSVFHCWEATSQDSTGILAMIKSLLDGINWGQ